LKFSIRFLLGEKKSKNNPNKLSETKRLLFS